MQKIPAEIGELRAVNRLDPRRAIERVADHGESERGEMHAQLMRAARVQVRFDQRERAEEKFRGPIGARGAAIAAACGHARAPAQIARYRQLDSSGLLAHLSVQQRHVSFFHQAFLKLLDQAALISDMKKRYAIYDQAQLIIIADAPWVFLLHPVQYVMRKPWVHGYIMNPMRPTRFEPIWLSPRTSD